MNDLELRLTSEEREYLVELLKTTLKDTRIEEHRTESPTYREYVIHRKETVIGLLNKLGEPTEK